MNHDEEVAQSLREIDLCQMFDDIRKGNKNNEASAEEL